MTISAYAGLPGEGKSYSALANFIIPSLKDGRVVAHNLMLNEAALEVVTGRKVSKQLVQIPRECTPDDLIKLVPLGAVVVIDEIWRYWPAGLTVKDVPREQVAFFKEHRHRVDEKGESTEILVIDQDPRTGIPAFLRALIENTYIHTKHSRLGVKSRFRVDVYSQCQPIDKPAKGKWISGFQGKYKPEVWNCYISHTQAKQIGTAGMEKKIDKRANIWRSPKMIAAMSSAAALPLAIFLGYKAFAAMAPKPLKQSAAQVRAERVPATQTATSLKPIQDRPAVQESTAWRVSGYADWGDRRTTVVYLVSATGERSVLADGNCHRDETGAWWCKVDGSYATPWSGKGTGGFNAALAPGVAQRRDGEGS